MAFKAKRVFLVLSIIIGVIFVGFVLAWFLIVPGIIESRANAALTEVADKTGRHIVISDVSLGGLTRANIGRVTISDINQPEKTGVQVDDLSVSLSGLPIGDFSISTIEVGELNVTVRVASGESNFEDILEALKPKEKKEGGATAPAKPKPWKKYFTPFPTIRVSSLGVTMPSVKVNDVLEIGAVSASDIEVKTDALGRYGIEGELSALLLENTVPTTYRSHVSGNVKDGKDGEISVSAPKSDKGVMPAMLNQEKSTISFDSISLTLPTTFTVSGLNIVSGSKKLLEVESARARLMTLPPKKVSGVYLKEIELVKPKLHDYYLGEGSELIRWATSFAGQIMESYGSDVKKEVEKKAAEVAMAAVDAGIHAAVNDSPNPGEDVAKAIAEEIKPKKKNVKDYFFSQRMFITDGSMIIDDQKSGYSSLALEHIDAEVGYRSIRRVLDYQISVNAQQPVTSRIELSGQYSMSGDSVKGELVVHPLRSTETLKKIQSSMQENNVAEGSNPSFIERMLPTFNLDNTEFEASIGYAYSMKTEDLNLKSRLSVKEFVWQLESLSKEPTSFSGSAGFELSANLGKKTFQVEHIDIDTNGAKFGLKAQLEKTERVSKVKGSAGSMIDDWQFSIAADMPLQNMDVLFEALPHAMRSELDGLTWKGMLEMHFEASGYLGLLSEVQHKFSILPSPDFAIAKWPADRNMNILNNGFKFNVQDPNAVNPHSIAIPPSIYPIFNGDWAIYSPRMTAGEVRSSYPDWVLFDDLNPWLIQLITTTEDGTFFTHEGFSPLQFKAALEKNVNRGAFSRGASTISMQLVKNIFFERNKTISRKFQEIVYTWIMESVMRIPKMRIMEIYFNIIELGPEIYGLENAAKYYFGKRSSDLSLKECAFLMAIIPHPRDGAGYRTSGTPTRWLQSTMNFYINEMYRRKCDQESLARMRDRYAKQGKMMPFEPCCPPKDSLQLMRDSELKFYVPDPSDPTKSGYRPDMYSEGGMPLNPVKSTSCGYHGTDFENVEEVESIFEAFVPAGDMNE